MREKKRPIRIAIERAIRELRDAGTRTDHITIYHAIRSSPDLSALRETESPETKLQRSPQLQTLVDSLAQANPVRATVPSVNDPSLQQEIYEALRAGCRCKPPWLVKKGTVRGRRGAEYFLADE